MQILTLDAILPNSQFNSTFINRVINVFSADSKSKIYLFYQRSYVRLLDMHHMLVFWSFSLAPHVGLLVF